MSTQTIYRGLVKDGRGVLILLVVSVVAIVTVLSHTMLVLRTQQSVAIALDIAGRQRMLNQRHLQEVLLACQGFEADYASTRRIFVHSLRALTHGGDVVVNLETGELARLSPTANDEIRQSLTRQGALFRRSAALADAFLQIPQSDSEYRGKLLDLQALKNETHLAANQSVKLLTQHSGLRSATSILWELFAGVLVGSAGIMLGIHLSRVNKRLRGEVVRRQRTQQALEKAHDILEDRVRTRTEELERSNQDLERFACVVSHDLQAPLQTITGYIEEIRARDAEESQEHLDEFARFFLDNALDSAHRMQRLVHRVLEYSRVGRDPVELEQVDLTEVVNEVVADLGSRLSEAEATVKIGCASQIFIRTENIELSASAV